jgi:hypothetical protein
MTDTPDDPHQTRIGLYGQAIMDGKLLLETLREQEHYTAVLQVLSASTPDQLAALALTVAADAAATRSEQADSGDMWLNWWKGVDSPDDPNPTAMDTSPAAMWRTLRPEQFDADS